MTACDYCVCWFCNLRKECPEIGNHCENEEQAHCPYSITLSEFACPDGDFEIKVEVEESPTEMGWNL